MKLETNDTRGVLRGIYRDLIAQYPSADRDQLNELYIKAIKRRKNADELIATVLRNHGNALYIALTREADHSNSQARNKGDRVDKLLRQADQALLRKTLPLLNRIMPNDKELGECTGREMRGMRLGRVYLEIEKQLGNDEKVSEWCTNRQLNGFRRD